MTTWTLTGTLKDSEGNEVVVGESTSQLASFQRSTDFYRNNGFTGCLMIVRTHSNGVETRTYAYFK